MTSAITPEPILRLDKVTVGYGRQAVVRDINAALYPGELVCLLGPNGAGKSTLMNTLAGNLKPLSGGVLLDNLPLKEMKPQELAQRIAVVLTERVQVGILTVYDLVALGRYPYTNWAGKLTANDHDRIRAAIDAAGAGDLAERNVSELSDGERQRVMLARALAQEPLLMLLDEITAFLDLPRRVGLMRTLRALARTTGRAILISTHDLDLALRSADTLWLLPKGGPLHIGGPEDLALSGAFGATFASEGVTFDGEQGAFRLTEHPVATARIIGSGLAAVWARRALERADYAVTEEGSADVLVETEGGEGAVGTVTRFNSEPHPFDSLAGLVRFLRDRNVADRTGRNPR